MQPSKRQVADALTRAREALGDDAPSYGQLERWMLRVLGEDGTPRADTIRGWHDDGVLPERAQIEAMRLLAHFYKIELRDIHPTLDRRWVRSRSLAPALDLVNAEDREAEVRTIRDLVFSDSSCKRITPGQRAALAPAA